MNTFVFDGSDRQSESWHVSTHTNFQGGGFLSSSTWVTEVVLWICGGDKVGVESKREIDSKTGSPNDIWKGICLGCCTVTDF